MASRMLPAIGNAIQRPTGNMVKTMGRTGSLRDPNEGQEEKRGEKENTPDSFVRLKEFGDR